MSLLQEAPPEKTDHPWLTNLLALLVYLGLSLWAYWPALRTLNSHLIGAARGDAMRNAWGYWWTRFMLVDHLRWPAQTEMLNHPHGQLILTIDSLNCLLSLPLQVLLSSPGGYNAFLICATAFSGLGGFLLARHLTGSAPAALVAGAVYGLTPYTLSAAPAGTSELLNVGWIPVFFLFLHRSLTTGARRDGVLAGVFLVCTTAANWYYGYMASLFAIPVVLIGLLGRGWAPRRAQVRNLEWMLLVFGLFVLGMLLVYGDVVGHVSSAMETGAAFRQRLTGASINLGDLWQPTPSCWDRPSLYHLPWLAQALVGLGILVTPRRAAVPLGLGLVAVLLSMSYQEQSAPWMADGMRPALGLLSQAAAGLYDLFLNLPFAGMIRFPMRWMVMANLAAATLVALGLARLLSLLPRIPALAIALILAVAVVGGALESSRYHEILERIPMPRSICLDRMLEDEEPGAVLHLPDKWAVGTQLLEQTMHQRPLVTSLDLVTSRIHCSPDGNSSRGLFLTLSDMDSVAFDPGSHTWPSRGFQAPEPALISQTLTALWTHRVRFVVIHREMFRPGDLEIFDRNLATRLELVAREGSTALYRVKSPPAEPGIGEIRGP